MQLVWDATITTPTSSAAPRQPALSEQRVMVCRRSSYEYVTSALNHIGTMRTGTGRVGGIRDSDGTDFSIGGSGRKVVLRLTGDQAGGACDEGGGAVPQRREGGIGGRRRGCSGPFFGSVTSVLGEGVAARVAARERDLIRQLVRLQKSLLDWMAELGACVWDERLRSGCALRDVVT